MGSLFTSDSFVGEIFEFSIKTCQKLDSFFHHKKVNCWTPIVPHTLLYGIDNAIKDIPFHPSYGLLEQNELTKNSINHSPYT